MEDKIKDLEKYLLKTAKEKEETDKFLLTLEIVMGLLFIAIMVVAFTVAMYLPIDKSLQALLICVGLIPLLIALPFLLKIEQIAGYYKCGKCGHKHVPKYSSVFWAMHMGWTRYMKCPECGKRSWQKKVLKNRVVETND